MNNQQKKILNSWRRLLWEFARREWLSVLVWSALGALGAGLTHLLLSDQLFKAFAVTTYLPPAKRFDDTRVYIPVAVAIALMTAAAATIYITEMIARGFRSWAAGVTSGLCFLPFISMFMVLTIHHGSVESQLLTYLTIVVCGFFIGYALHIAARVYSERTLKEEELRVPFQSRSLVGTELSESDDPIQSWREDALGRASLVDSMAIKLIVAKSPVIALFGEFGSGKSSILNLLREHLSKKAIVVSFSTWLPGSQETLTSYLLGDIANECRKHYVVPGLSKSARRLTSALAQTVPFLKGYAELFPAATQKDDIEALNASLERLPKRIVVLLDELDRMEKDEVLTLLKVVRGISSLRNLSFVCATDRNTIVRTVKGTLNDDSNLFFEKFFPVSVQIPKADTQALRKAGIQRLVAALNRQSWFESDSEAETFRKQVEAVWSERIAPFCGTLRAIGLLANDVSMAGALLRLEVHPVDLTLVELLRRFRPSVYEIVGRNSVTLTGGELSYRGGGYHSEKEVERLKDKFLGDIQKATEGDDQAEQVKGVLSELFPRFQQIAGRSWVPRSKRQESEEGEKRIFHPGIFPAYFRYELPQGLFSSVELEAFVREIIRAGTDNDRQQAFWAKLDSMEKGSPKRDNFLEKLSDAVKSMNLQVGRAVLSAAMRAADKYVYDSIFVGLGEAGHVLRIVIRVAEKTPKSERVELLSQCIAEASDDTMAWRICTRLTGQKVGEGKDVDLGVSLEELYPSFAKRMRSRYGLDVDAATVDLATSDQNAFNLWGAHDPADRAVQQDFWLRYIGNSRSRLADVFQRTLLPLAIYTSDPTQFVENKISTQELKRLYEALPEEGTTELERKSLRRLKRFLDGEFKNGAGLEFDPYGEDEAEGETSGPPG